MASVDLLLSINCKSIPIIKNFKFYWKETIHYTTIPNRCDPALIIFNNIWKVPIATLRK